MDASQTSLFNAFLIIGIIVTTVLVYFIISIIGHQRRNKKLYKSKILAEITTLEKERQRISADLHDELGPILASVKFKISSLDINSNDDAKTINKISDNLDKLIHRLRGISNDLVPYTLLRKGLVAALEESIEMINRSNNLEVIFTHNEIPPLPQDKAVNLFRILQEIIHNTTKHAKATELKIEMKKENATLYLLTSDNGIGFDPIANQKGSAGLGLRNLLSRTEILGGNMYIHSKPGKGTRYEFEIPD